MRKNSTLIQRHGFQDPDLTTPEHDKMVLWCSKNVEEILRTLDIVTGWRSQLYCENRGFRGDCNWNWRKGECTASCCPYATEENKNNFIKETKQNFEHYKKNKVNMFDFVFGKMIVSWEPAILGYNNYNIGFLDLVAKFPKTSTRYEGGFGQFMEIPTIYFEIKPKITSIGETMRQLNLYRSHLGKEKEYKIILVTKTPDFKEVFESQGIGYYVYKEEDDVKIERSGKGS